ncbi:MAG: phosphoenolpyruvate--protein phosphotransferase, partial [Spirochaetaceae bacterium]|nr:phosphoenolpyruvate--protein phosphotransferase [Spirochaetaceae bacterium]
YGNLKIMFPMITSCGEVDNILKIVKSVKTELKKEKLPFAEDVPLGVMIETPSAAIVSDFLAKKCSFFSIGTNDLTQYSLSVDRDNSHVSNLYNETHPAVLRLINTTVKNANKRRIPVSVCGEFASRPEGIALLTGMGIREFSMSSSMLLAVKDTLRQFTVAEFQNISKTALKTPTVSKINEIIKRKLNK